MNTIAVVCMLPILIVVIHADTCPTVTVVEISNKTGEVGKYFMFPAEEFTRMTGDNWDGYHYKIVQSGSQLWEGIVDVWKKKDTSAGEGIKRNRGAAGDWKVNDTITLKSCSNPDKHPCKDVTFGECDPNEFPYSIVLSEKLLQTVQLCNAECYNTYNCTNYRYINQTQVCTLMSADYRVSTCNISAGPKDKKDIDCIGQISNQICDSHVEEDCEYNGDLLMEYPEGNIASADTCQESCESDFADCKYWIYHNMKSLCILKRDGKRTCSVWGGPKQPSYDHCKNL